MKYEKITLDTMVIEIWYLGSMLDIKCYLQHPALTDTRYNPRRPGNPHKICCAYSPTYLQLENKKWSWFTIWDGTERGQPFIQWDNIIWNCIMLIHMTCYSQQIVHVPLSMRLINYGASNLHSKTNYLQDYLDGWEKYTNSVKSQLNRLYTTDHNMLFKHLQGAPSVCT